jgi:1-acylglycerone phosphate reductase
MAPKTLKAVLITGCSNGGIGAALAAEFQKRGHTVFAAVRNPDKASDLAELPNVTILTLDVTAQESINAAVIAVSKALDSKPLDILINNAGHGSPSPILDADIEATKKMFDVNIWGTVAMCQAFQKQIVASKGTIVNVCSVGSIIPTPYIGMYGGSKAAIKMITQTLRLEMRPFGVKVITAMIGSTRTKFGDNITDVALHHDSLYKPVETFVNDTPGGQRGKMDNIKMAATEVAKRLTTDILAGKTGEIYRGGLSTTSWFVMWFFPAWITVSFHVPLLDSFNSNPIPRQDWLLTQDCGFDKLTMSSKKTV